jgi:SSS family solute:Na+ symporter
VIKSLHSDLYVYLQSVQGYLSPAIASLFLFGVFWRRATAPAALWAFIVGTLAGFARLAADLTMRDEATLVSSLKQQLYRGAIDASQYAAAIAPIRARHPWIFDFWNLNWLYFAQASLVGTASIIVIVSLMTQPPERGAIKYTWYGATAEEKAATRASWTASDVALSVIVLIVTVIFYVTFW